jgi:glycosyltransferase involved in cell wall biosynthesis
MTRAGVMHLVDTLDAGGAERVAVNLVNLLPRDRYRVHLCTTRRDGALGDLVDADVARLSLARNTTWDVHAIGVLRAYIARHRIRILHAHQTTLFTAAAIAMLPPFPHLVWHDHFGRHDVERRCAWLYRPPVRLARAVISVTRALAAWAIATLGVPARRVFYLPNFSAGEAASIPDLPGTAGGRIVCVANFRPQKDHLTLLRAMAHVLATAPAAHLLLVGDEVDAAYSTAVREEARRLGIERSVSFLGSRRDVSGILRGSDVGILSSTSEGLPLALIEYGHAALPAVATRVGECPDVLSGGKAGALVASGDVHALADALLRYLRDPQLRAATGKRLQRRVQGVFSPEAGLQTIEEIYDTILGVRGRASLSAA